MVIVENINELNLFFDKWNTQSCSIIPIWCDLEKHPLNNELSFLYVSFDAEDFILPFNHTDCIPLSTSNINLSDSDTEKWVWDKKAFLQSGIQIKNLKDVQTALFFEQNKLYDFTYKIEKIANFYMRLHISKLHITNNLGKSIPIMKWAEVLKEIISDWNLTHTNTWVDNVMIPALSEVETKGIRVDVNKFLSKWSNSQKHLKGDMVYTYYNPYTITSRPSNRHGGINFSALNKEDGTRDIFIPTEGNTLVQMDYDAYHVRLISKIIHFQLPTTSVHRWLADQYGMEYNEAKKRTFRILYGGVSEEDKKILFFKKVDEYIQSMYSKVKQTGWVSTLHRKIHISHIENPTPQKIFNYLLQATETELNIEILKELIHKNHTPIMYAYDSFIFDIPKDRELVLKIKSIVEKLGFPVNLTTGKTYSDL